MTLTVKKKKLFIIAAPMLLIAPLAIFYLWTATQNKTETATCSNIEPYDQQIKCWVDNIEAIIQRKGIHVTFAAISDRFLSEPRFRQSCNEILHQVGHWTYHYTTHNNIKLVAPPNITVCASAFTRAFVHELTSSTGDFTKAVEFCTDPQIASESSQATASCYHGIGHGTFSFYAPKMAGEKQQTMITRALEECSKIGLNQFQLEDYCAGGVFSEVIRSFQTKKYGIVVNAKRPFSFCQGSPEPYKNSCYATAHPLLLWLTHDDFPKAASLIENTVEDMYAIGAMQNLGSSVTKRNIRNNISIADYAGDALVCRGLQKRLRLPCIEGLAKEFLMHGPPVAPIDALHFCNLSVLTEQEKKLCLRFVVSQLPEWTQESEMRKICSSLEDKYKNLCHES